MHDVESRKLSAGEAPAVQSADAQEVESRACVQVQVASHGGHGHGHSSDSELSGWENLSKLNLH